MSELREKKIWNGTSPEGFSYEIVLWGEGTMCHGHGMWNYYITIHQDQLRPEDWEKVWLPVACNYRLSNGEDSPIYEEYNSVLSVGDFHGGITFYEKGQSVDSNHRWIKVGCDYGHLCDEERGYGYELEEVQRDALMTCQKLANVLCPLVRCTFTGLFFDPRFDVSENTPGWKGGPLSPAGLGIRSKWDRERSEGRGWVI